MSCACPVCKQRTPNLIGIEIAENEVIPFVKTELLKLRYPTHPFPHKYKDLVASIYAFSQALHQKRANNVEGKYYTSNKWLLKFTKELEDRFGLPIVPESELNTNSILVCEFNTEDKI